MTQAKNFGLGLIQVPDGGGTIGGAEIDSYPGAAAFCGSAAWNVHVVVDVVVVDC